MKYALLMPIVASAVAAECGGTSTEESSEPPEQRSAELGIDVAQARFDAESAAMGPRGDLSVQSVTLPVDRVEAHFAESGWVAIRQAPFVLTLLPERASQVVREIEPLIKQRVGAGTLTELRFVLQPGARAHLSSGGEAAVGVPSGAESGLKVVLADAKDIAPCETLTIRVDLDAQLGNAGRALMLRPTMKVAAETRASAGACVEPHPLEGLRRIRNDGIQLPPGL